MDIWLLAPASNGIRNEHGEFGGLRSAEDVKEGAIYYLILIYLSFSAQRTPIFNFKLLYQLAALRQCTFGRSVPDHVTLC
jgi:hypothetical protein